MYISQVNQAPRVQKLDQLLDRIKPGQIALALFDSFPEVLFWVKDCEGTFLYVNRAFSQYTRKPFEDLIGHKDAQIFPGEFAEIFQRDDAELIKSGRAIMNKDELLINSSGIIEWWATSKIPLVDHNDGIVGTAGFSRQLSYSSEQPVPGIHGTLTKVLAHIQENIHSEITVADLAKFSNTSVSTMERMFRTHLHTTPKQFIIRAKITASCRMLLDTNMTVSEIAHNLGYLEHASFTRMFTKTMNVSPLAYRKAYKSR